MQETSRRSCCGSVTATLDGTGGLCAQLSRSRRSSGTSYWSRNWPLTECDCGGKQEGNDSVLPADALSDGTLRFICLATLLGQPELPGLIILDEPELGLHPFAIVQLAGMLRAASQDSQVVLATPSVTLINQFELSDLIIVERREGASVFEQPDPDRLSEWLAEYSLGELWEKNLLGGGPRP
jgi:hypothetical protein